MPRQGTYLHVQPGVKGKRRERIVEGAGVRRLPQADVRPICPGTRHRRRHHRQPAGGHAEPRQPRGALFSPWSPSGGQGTSISTRNSNPHLPEKSLPHRRQAVKQVPGRLGGDPAVDVPEVLPGLALLPEEDMALDQPVVPSAPAMAPISSSVSGSVTTARMLAV